MSEFRVSFWSVADEAALPSDLRAALRARGRPLLARPYRLPLRHELTWTRLAR